MFNYYRINGNVAEVQIGCNVDGPVMTTVSASQIPVLESYDKKFHISTKGYPIANVMKEDGMNTCIPLHRLLCNTTEEKPMVDHINGDVLDNTDDNLRAVTNAENTFNSVNKIVDIDDERLGFLHEYAELMKVDLRKEMGRAGLIRNGLIRIGDARKIIKKLA